MKLQKYVLMNQEIKVLDFNFDEELNVITEILNIYNIEFAPYKLKCEYDEKNNIDRISINKWYEGRGIPIHRDNVRDIIEQFNIDTTKELINKHFALSLSDQFWIKPVSSSIEWKNINYFDNAYDVVNFTNATFGQNASDSLKGISSTISDKLKTPNNTTDGQLKKVWLKIDNKNYLYKGAGSLHNLEPINEVIASKICKILEVPYVPYKIDTIHSKRQDTLVSICECTINKNQEIITAYNILPKNQEKDFKEYYNIYLNILNDNNVPNAKEYLEKMFMLDYIMLNEDRHLNNFGIIRDVRNLKWVSICPIFDTGRSMNTNVTSSYWDFNQGEVKCFTPNFVSSEILTEFFSIKISQNQLLELKKIPIEYERLLNKYKEYIKLSEEQISLLTNGLNYRINIFNNIVGR